MASVRCEIWLPVHSSSTLVRINFAMKWKNHKIWFPAYISLKCVPDSKICKLASSDLTFKTATSLSRQIVTQKSTKTK